MRTAARILALLIAIGVARFAAPATAQSPAPGDGKPGGVLRLVLREDDPDANFYENYACGSPRNYGDYCNEEVGRLVDQQSQETDVQKRLALVWQIQKKLEEDAARPTMGWRTDRFAHHPYVKNLIPNQVTYNCCRLQEVWLDK